MSLLQKFIEKARSLFKRNAAQKPANNELLHKSQQKVVQKSFECDYNYVVPLHEHYYNLSIERLYEIPLIRASLDRIANAAAQVPLHFYDVNGNIIDKTVERYIPYANSRNGFTTFVKESFIKKYIYGINIIQRNGFNVFNIDYNDKNYIVPAYDNDIITARYFINPYDVSKYYPLHLSLKKVLKRHENNVEAMMQYTNNGNYAGVLTIKATDGTIASELNTQIAEQTLAKYFGGAKNAGKLTVLPVDTNFHKIFFTVEEAGLIEFYKFDLQDISRLLNIPAVLLGDNEASTYNNVKEARYSFYLDTIMPELDELCEKLTLLYTKPLKNVGITAYISFERSDIPIDNFNDIANYMLQLYDRQIVTKDDLIKLVKR